MVSSSNGQVAESFVRKCRLSDDQRSQYPLALLKLMKRHAEDRIWANDVKEGKRVLEFLILLMRKRQGVKDMRAGELY